MTNLKMLNWKYKIACKGHKLDANQNNMERSCQRKRPNPHYFKPRTTWPLDLQIHKEAKSSPKEPPLGLAQLAVEYPLPLWLYHCYHLKISRACLYESKKYLSSSHFEPRSHFEPKAENLVTETCETCKPCLRYIWFHVLTISLGFTEGKTEYFCT